MSNIVEVSFPIIEASTDLQLIDLLLKALKQFEGQLDPDELDRAVNYFFRCYQDNAPVMHGQSMARAAE
jgi:hypothetical protein